MRERNHCDKSAKGGQSAAFVILAKARISAITVRFRVKPGMTKRTGDWGVGTGEFVV